MENSGSKRAFSSCYGINFEKVTLYRIDAVSSDAIMAGQSFSNISSESFCGKI